MTIYDKLVGCIPVNKIAGTVIGLKPDDFKPYDVEEKINILGKEMFQINKTLSSIKNNNFITTKEKEDILKRKYEIEEELTKLKKNKELISGMAFSNVFYRVCKEKLPQKTFKEIYEISDEIIKYVKNYIINKVDEYKDFDKQKQNKS